MRISTADPDLQRRAWELRHKLSWARIGTELGGVSKATAKRLAVRYCQRTGQPMPRPWPGRERKPGSTAIGDREVRRLLRAWRGE